MSTLIVDASAALMLLRQEPGHAEVRAVLQQRVSAGDAILVPGLFWLEVVNVLAMRYRWAPASIVEAVYEIEQLGVETADAGRPAVLAVIDVIGQSRLTAYDAAYLVLAEAADGHVLTADAALAAAAGDRAIYIGGGRVAETGARYRPTDAWPTWRGATTYLAELRRSI